MLDGTRTVRITVASRSSAPPTPKPICWKPTRSPVANPANTTTMISAAPVMIRPVALIPC